MGHPLLLVLVVASLLFVLSLLPHLASAASWPDPGAKHWSLDPFWPSQPGAQLLYESAEYTIMSKSGTSTQSSSNSADTPPPAALGSSGLDATAIRRAVTSGLYDIVALKAPCSQVVADHEVATVVAEGRRQGTVMPCLDGPLPVFSDLVPGGMNVSVNLTNTAGLGGVTYNSTGAYEAAADLELVIPQTLYFETANETKTIDILVFLKSSSGCGGGRGSRTKRDFGWCTAHVEWQSPPHQSIQRVFHFRQAL